MSNDVRAQLQRTLGTAYTLEQELGGGGMSRVFVAEETALGRRVVVKVLPPELMAGLSVERFNREILVAAKLQHPHIVPVLAAGETGGLPYYTMPFVEGESLRLRLARAHVLAITDVVGVLRDVAKALAYAHERGIVHRDIKPDNVLMTGGSATVTDFGIAKAISAARSLTPSDTLTQVGTSIGTPVYMSPEQAAADPSTDHRTDIYSFGCTAYELLSGRPPFIGLTPRKLLAAHMGEKPQPIAELRPDTPFELAALVMHCLEKEADARPQTAADLVRVLETVTSGKTQPAMPAVLLGGKGMLRKALAMYAVAFVAVAIVSKAAIVVIGLPDWVFPGTLVVMALGLPVILLTGYVQQVTRRVLTATPTYTPGGTPSLERSTMTTFAIKASPHVSWRRTALGGMWALGVFVALVTVFMGLRELGIGPFGSLLSTGTLDAKSQILLIDFRTTNTDSALGRVASDAVRQGLLESSVITLTSPATITAALARMQRPASSVIDTKLGRELAQREGIKAIIDGEVASAGTGYIVSLKLVTADSGTALAVVSAAGEGSQGLIDAVDKATRALRGKVGESLRRINAMAPLADVTTPSLDALRKYSEAQRANYIAGNSLQAVRLLREAVAIDTGFASAWRLLGVSMSNAGMLLTPRDSAIEKAHRLRDRLQPRERLQAEGVYYNMLYHDDRTGADYPFRHGDRAKALAALQSFLQLGMTADSATGENSIGLMLTRRRDFEQADSAFAISLRLRPEGFQAYGNRMVTMIALGRIDQARAAARDPTRAANVAYSAGDRVRYRHIVDSVAARPSNDGQWARYRYAESALADGRPSEWRRRFAAAAAVDAAEGIVSVPLADSAIVALVDAVVLDSGARAARRLDHALALWPLRSIGELDRPYWLVIAAYAAAGRTDKARSVLAQIGTEVTDTAFRRVSEPWYHKAAGRVALSAGRFAEAVNEFRRGEFLPDGPVTDCTICLSYELARAFDGAGQRDSAVAMYESFLRTRYYWRNQLLHDPLLAAPVHRRLGELYEAAGNTPKAIEHYRAFVDLWKNAEPELQSRVSDARRRIAKLGG